jgi:hypothetical protein
MGWMELRGAIEAQISLFDNTLRQWREHQTSLADARGRLHGTLDSSNHLLARNGLQAADLAPGHAGKATEHLARAVQLCRDYLHAVDPDNANGSIRGLEAPQAKGARHGGHGGPNVPPARQPVTDPSRRRSHVYTEQDGATGLADMQNRDDGIIGARHAWIRCGGHALDRHGGQVTDQKLKDRAQHGKDPMTGDRTDWQNGRLHRYSQHATAFTSDSALVFAEMRIYDSRQAQAKRQRIDPQRNQYTVAVPAAQVLGPDFRDHIRGWSRVGTANNPTGVVPTSFPDNTEFVATYKRLPGAPWGLHTCFPNFA